MSPIEILDSTLSYINKAYGENKKTYPKEFDEIFRFLNKADSSIDSYLARAVIAKLIKDGYVTEKIIRRNAQDITHYVLTFEGMAFLQSGGYNIVLIMNEQQREAQATAARISSQREIALLYWTAAVAVGAIGLVVWEMIKTFWIERH